MKHFSILTLTRIALGVSALIVGGAVIYFISRFLPFPGTKYILMSPYLSLVIYVLMKKIPYKGTPLLICIIFGSIMSFVQLFMGLAILLTGVFTTFVSLLGRNKEERSLLGGVGFSTFTTFSALFISKYLLGGAFLSIPNWWIGIATLLGTFAGIVGVLLGRNIYPYISKATLDNR